MRKRLLYGFAIVLLVFSVVLVVWQGSFSLKDFPPSNPSQTLIFWAMSTLIFILMVTVGWILVREFVKLYVARQANRAGSRIRTKLAVGAMSLSCVPAFFLVLWSYELLNFNSSRWFPTRWTTGKSPTRPRRWT
jgi:nitrogen fixation/metabolism regulation signal transduction histidine kinase